jgi:hypothetical protein
MKAFILLFIIVLLAPVANLQAQAGSNYNHHSSYPQYYYVRTVSGHGIIPTTSIQIIDKDGRSISCSSRDLNSQNKSRQLCKIDSLINTLETCQECKIVKTTAQMDTIYKLSAKITPVDSVKNCIPGYGGAAYAMYERKDDGSLHLSKNIAKGCGKTVDANKLIDDFIAKFEKPGDKNLLKEQNKALAEKENKTISDSAHKDFIAGASNNSEAIVLTGRITADSMLRIISNTPLTSVELVFYERNYNPQTGKLKPSENETPSGISKLQKLWQERKKLLQQERENTSYSLIYKTYQLRKKSGSNLYDIDLKKELSFYFITKLKIIGVTETGEKAAIMLFNKTKTVDFSTE